MRDEGLSACNVPLQPRVYALEMTEFLGYQSIFVALLRRYQNQREMGREYAMVQTERSF
jgi:hypothetical protein